MNNDPQDAMGCDGNCSRPMPFFTVSASQYAAAFDMELTGPGLDKILEMLADDRLEMTRARPACDECNPNPVDYEMFVDNREIGTKQIEDCYQEVDRLLLSEVP